MNKMALLGEFRTTWETDIYILYTKYIFVTHYSDVIWALWRFKSPASRLFAQPFIQAQIKENIKAPHHWPLWGEFTGDRWIPHTMGQQCGKCLHLITSSWSIFITRDSEGIMFSPAVSVFCVVTFLCHDVCLDDLIMTDWCYIIFCRCGCLNVQIMCQALVTSSWRHQVKKQAKFWNCHNSGFIVQTNIIGICG